jgi:ribosomal protein S18 acetylase RimI-like enzyme
MAGARRIRMITYRSATPDDAIVLDRLFDTSFCDAFAHLYRAEDLEEFLSSFGIDDWRAQLGDPSYAVQIAEADGQPVGYVKLGPLKIPVETDRRAILLDQFYVLKEHHGSGVAKALMDWAIEETARRAADEIYLTVFIDNHRARRFYDRYGFEPVGRYDFMVGSQADHDIIMRKQL